MGSAEDLSNDHEVCFAISQWAIMTGDAFRTATSLLQGYSYRAEVCNFNQSILTAIVV